MGDYAKLAVFIAVLLLSVSMMSVAINYLGDLSDVELEMEPQSEETEAISGQSGEAAMGKGNTISAEGIPGGEVFPLFEIRYPPMTRYMRRLVGEVYGNGEWTEAEGHTPVLYVGGEIPLSITSTTVPTPVFYNVNPFFNISGYIPATLSVARIEFDGGLERYPSLELFSSPDPFSTDYNVTYVLYDFSEAELLGGNILDMDEYLDVPEELEGRFRELAQGIAGSLSNPYMRLRALESYLKENLEYDREFTPSPPDIDPVEWFIFEEKVGLCSQFNSAFVLLARSLGIPARVVMGYIVKPDVDYQLVMPKQTHLWAEVPFEGLGWITFDATPQRIEEEPTQVQRTPTITNITYNDDMALKGGLFIVQGTVTTFNGSAVDGLSVEVLLKVNKNETGVQCGLGTVVDGFFEISCEADPGLAVGDYNLVAHALPNAVYEESWSDPAIRIMTETEVSIQAPESVYVSEYFTIVGRLVDRSNGQPIQNAGVTMVVGGETGYYITDDDGVISLTHSYETEGNETVTVFMDGTEYYLGSNSSFGIAVSLPPPPKQGLLQMLTTFPYNFIIAAVAVVAVGVVVAATRKPTRLASRGATERRPVQEVEEEMPRRFEDHKEGIVKLFNWFYRFTQRRFEGIADSMTPREFQQAVLGKIPPNGTQALEYLVTAFEIADYSDFKPTKEMFDKSLRAVELLRSVIEHGG